MKYIIVGVTKCGTTSLSKYLTNLGHIVLDFEYLATRKGGTIIYDSTYLHGSGFLHDFKPVLIFRNEIDRKISFTNYYKKNPHLLKGQDDEYDIDNIISQWKYSNPLIFHLEEMTNKDGFLCLNSTNIDRNNGN